MRMDFIFNEFIWEFSGVLNKLFSKTSDTKLSVINLERQLSYSILIPVLHFI